MPSRPTLAERLTRLLRRIGEGELESILTTQERSLADLLVRQGRLQVTVVGRGDFLYEPTRGERLEPLPEKWRPHLQLPPLTFEGEVPF